MSFSSGIEEPMSSEQDETPFGDAITDFQDNFLDENSWTKNEEEQLRAFFQTNPSINKNDERGKKGRDKLWDQLKSNFQGKFSVEQMQLKLLDIQGKWRSEDIEEVISFYQRHPVLWDTSLTEYRDRTMKNIALEELMRMLSYRKTEAEIKAKFDNLKTTYLGIKKAGKTGSGGKKTKPWPFYEQMTFITKSSCEMETFSNIPQTSPSSTPATPIAVDKDEEPSTDNKLQHSNSNNSQNVRRHRKHTGGGDDDVLREKLMKCLDTAQDGADGFAVSVRETLKKFSGVNQEFVKAQIQQVLAISLQRQERDQDLPIFSPIN